MVETRSLTKAKRKRLEAAGWRFGTVAEFLGLDAAEEALVELHLALAKALRERRAKVGMTQVELARKIGSSQSRVAKMEAADASVTLDLKIRSLLALGVGTRELGVLIAAVGGDGASGPGR